MPFGDLPIYDCNSTPAAYLTPDEFFDFVDPDLIANCLSDGGRQRLTVEELRVSPRLNRLLLAASGQVEGEAVVGQRYPPEALRALTGAAQAKLKEIVARIAAFKVYSRRDGEMPPQNVVFGYQEAVQDLERLRLGAAVFATRETEEAGLPRSGLLTEDQLWYQNRLGLVWHRMFGVRVDQQRRDHRSYW